MSFISYAQNFEDVMLWRALKLFSPGLYIDIGANHPTTDSVTRSLYERGWRGINIEPVLHYYEALCSERPEDINLCVAIGNKEDELIFFESPETGLSTLSLQMADLQKSLGIPFIQRKVKTQTLTSICEEHVTPGKPLHFLKIDVEGFEEEVLQGMDLQKWRPWIILIESAFDKQPEWEALILDAAYKFALCDGINRFYVANERLELLAPLALPPNILDEFQLCRGHRLSQREADTSVLQQRLDSAMQRADLAERKLTDIYKSNLWSLAKILTKIKGIIKK